MSIVEKKNLENGEHTCILLSCRDPTLFPDPEQFDPTRHLSADGSAFRPDPNVLPFGAGKRRCVGETLAKMEAYRYKKENVLGLGDPWESLSGFMNIFSGKRKMSKKDLACMSSSKVAVKTSGSTC